MSIKQVILVNEALGLPRGKLAAQVAHAAVASMLTSNEALLKEWLNGGMPKVILAVDSGAELLRFYGEATNANLPAQIVKDAGKTVIAAGTATCVGIGPAQEAQINQITGNLKLVS
ncbi:MAG: peptidyl-tRNA hydrolase Pth2 [Pseudomonadales bacterium]